MPGDRNEQASPHRREKARKDGDILHSRELSAAVGTLAGVVCLGFLGEKILNSFRSSFSAALDLGGRDQWEASTLAPTLRAIRQLVMAALLPVGVVIGSIVSAALLAGILQTGGLQVNPESIGFRLDRISPASN